MSQEEISVGIYGRNFHLLKAKWSGLVTQEGWEGCELYNSPMPAHGCAPCPTPRLACTCVCSQGFVLCLKYRRGVQISKEGPICKGCGKNMDTLAEHAMNCRCGSGQYRRHDAIRDIIADAARSTSLSPRVEVPGLVEGSQERLGDILLLGWGTQWAGIHCWM